MHLEKVSANVRVTKFSVRLKSSEKNTKKLTKRRRSRGEGRKRIPHSALNMQISKWITHEYLKCVELRDESKTKRQGSRG